MTRADMYRHGNILCSGYDNHETKIEHVGLFFFALRWYAFVCL